MSAVIKFIYGKPAALVDDTLVIADLHLGVEEELEKKGVRVGMMFETVKEQLLAVVREEKPKRLVILGDVKHNIPGEERNRTLQLRVFFDELASLCELVIVPGNHDGGIEESARSAKIASSEGIALDGVGYTHGNAWPSEEVMKCEKVLVGHVHPCVEILGRDGSRSVERVWIISDVAKTKIKEKYPDAKVQKLVIVPAFNPLAGGRPLGRSDSLHGPLLRNGMFKFSLGQTYLLDGTGLGTVASLSHKNR